MPDTVSPTTFEEAAAALAGATADRVPVRILGAGTKHGWGAPGVEPAIVLSTGRLDATREHNAGDLTAVFEAGVPLARAQAELGATGQRLALDPPLGIGPRQAATIGGAFATADSGPLRHRYGGPRDLILGITVALGDGTVARAGGKVIKNVAGYDLGKLFTGSFGTLGAILAISVRLHPLPPATMTAMGASSSPAALGRAAIRLAREPFELEALDVAWRAGRGGLLAQVAGIGAARRSERVAAAMREEGLEDVELTGDDAALWARQRAGQRSASVAVLRVAARPSQLPAVLHAADAGSATLVGRAGLGLSYLELDPSAIGSVRVALPPGAVAVVLDLPADAHGRIDPWGEAEGAATDLMRSLKQRFDPSAICNPGVFVGGI